MDYPFFKKPASTHVSMPQKVWGTPGACSSPLLKESHSSPQDTPDLTKSSTDPSVLIEDEGGNDDDDDDEAPAPDRTGSSNVKGIYKSSKQQESPPPRKCGLKIWGPINRNHAKHPIHHRMNGVSVMGLRRDWITNKCVTSHLLWFWNWNSLSLKSVPSINLQFHIHPLCELQTNLLQAPRAFTVRPPAGSNRARRTSTTFGKRTQP